MKDILNLKVKHRERFRPFAPVVCVEDAPAWFECDMPIPLPTDYMLMVYPIIKEKQKLIPAVTHVDGSGRLQTIRREQNPRYYDVIKEFGKLTKVPILINTSYNIRGEPIVCTPHDAYRCMMGTGIDCLVMDKFLIKRADNPNDMWDSESIATD
jgi:carbamoyltransferase